MTHKIAHRSDGTTQLVHLSSWRKQHHDPRDEAYRIKLHGSLTARPPSCDNRPICSPVYDQGQIGSCFAGHVLVRLLNGQKKTFKELHDEGGEFWVYSSTEDGKIVPAIARCNLTGRAKKLVRVTLENGSEIDCTPDHRFMLRDGSYREAQHLTSDESLMPLYVRYDKNGYQMCFDNMDNKYRKTHSIVAYFCHSHQLETIQEDVKCVHHIDFNKRNNEPSNLRFMGLEEHFLYHASLAEFAFRNWNGTEEQRLHSQRVIQKQYEEDPSWNAGAPSKGGKQAHLNRMADPAAMEKWRREWQELGHSPEVRARAAAALRETVANRSEEERQEIARVHSKRMRSLLADPVFANKQRQQMAQVGKNSGKTKLVSYARQVLDRHGTISEDAWNVEKRSAGIASFPKFTSIARYFDDLEQLKEAAENYNHKILKVEDLGEVTDVYCLEVPEYHNFALAAGVFVHNCTANMLAGLVEANENRQNVSLGLAKGPAVTVSQIVAAADGTISYITKVSPGSDPAPTPTPAPPPAPAKFLQVSRLFEYYATRKIEGTVREDSGATIRDAVKCAAKYGVVDESAWPYDTTKIFSDPPASVWSEASTHKVKSYHSVADGDIETMRSILATGFLVGFGFQVYDYMLSAEMATKGVLNKPGPNESLQGGHAVCLVGYDDSKRMFLVRNSWGTGWGLDGYFQMSYDYVSDTTLCSDFWVVQSSPT